MAVMETREQSCSKEEFVKGMAIRGWRTAWTDSRKNITFENEDEKKVRDSNISKTFQMIDITTFDNILLRIDCNKAEEGIRTTPGFQCALNALAIDEPLEYARLALDGEMQMWVNAEDSLGIW